MRETKELPVLTDTFESAKDFRPLENSIYIFASTGELRASHIESWRSNIQGVKLCEICYETQSSFQLKGDSSFISLRSEIEIRALWNDATPNVKIYLDITGLTHSVWAGILKLQ